MDKNIVNEGSTAATFSQLYHSNGASEASAYDSLGRLITEAQGALSASGTNGSVLDTVSSATQTQSWSLDAQGNWSSVTTNGTAQTRSYNGQNQLTAVSGATTPTYDNNGNMTKDQTGNTYTFDAWNRMATVSASGSSTEFFGYLAGGQRASISVSGSTTDYSYFNDAWQEVEVDSNTGASGSTVMQDTYVWGLANINELVARDDSSSNRIYVQQDANWDVTALVGKVSGTWQVVERFSYSPYGVATVLNASWSSTTDGYGWVYRYQAGKFDSTSGLYNFRNRDYSPTLGQWMEADPAGYVQGANLYEANLGAPISHVDPYGLTPTTGSASAGNNAHPDPHLILRLTDLIRQLNDPDYHKREAAQEELTKMLDDTATHQATLDILREEHDDKDCPPTTRNRIDVILGSQLLSDWQALKTIYDNNPPANEQDLEDRFDLLLRMDNLRQELLRRGTDPEHSK